MTMNTEHLIPEGSWKARGGASDLGTAKTGTRQVAVEIVLLEGPAAGQRLTWYGYFGPSDEAFERTIESLELLGWKGDDLSDLSGIGDTEVYAVITHEPDLEGEIKARVAWINEVGGVAMSNRMDAGEKAAFAAEMKGRLLARRQRGGGNVSSRSVPSARTTTSGKPGATHVMPDQSDDEIPF